MIKEIKYGPYKGKINELINIINAIQKEREAERFEIQEWIGILETVRQSVNIHEKQIDELQMKTEPDKLKPVHNAVKRANKKLDSKLEIAMDALLRIAECLPKTAYTVHIAQQAIDKIKEKQ